MFIACLDAVLFYPFETIVVPEWKVRVVDRAFGKPVTNVVVTEGWRHHSIEIHRHDENRITDNQGYVYFPRRTVRASLLHRVAGMAVAALHVHGQSGPRAFIVVAGSYDSDTDYWPGKPLREIITVPPPQP